MNRLIIITGPLASGKSTLARNLSPYFDAELFIKDVFKESLADQYGFSSREENYRLSLLAVSQMLINTETKMKEGRNIIVEANFRQAQIADFISLADKYGYRYDLLLVTCDFPIAYQRFIARMANRHKAHLSLGLDKDYDKFLAYNQGILSQIEGFSHLTIDSTYSNVEDLYKQTIKLLQGEK